MPPALRLILPRICPFARPAQPLHLPNVRHQSSARRNTKRLRIKPSSLAPIAERYMLEAPPTDHVIFNPPSAAPSPYYTPQIFLPKNDPRRAILASSHAHFNPYGPAAAATTATTAARSLPPPLKPVRSKVYHLTAEQIAEIRTLRTEDPWLWTRAKLAEKFGCTEFFVGMCVQASKERMDWHEKNLEAAKARWGSRKRNARDERLKRRELWGRDA